MGILFRLGRVEEKPNPATWVPPWYSICYMTSITGVTESHLHVATPPAGGRRRGATTISRGVSGATVEEHVEDTRGPSTKYDPVKGERNLRPYKPNKNSQLLRALVHLHPG